jgi:hypothetical protein
MKYKSSENKKDKKNENKEKPRNESKANGYKWYNNKIDIIFNYSLFDLNTQGGLKIKLKKIKIRKRRMF